MRDCSIKIGNDGKVTVSQVTEYIEEHGATQLVITLNNELKTDNISYYTLCFKPGAALKNPPDVKITSDMINLSENGTLTYPLPSGLTCFGSLDVQVQAHVIDNSGRMASLIKSPVFRLGFEPSITGDEEFIIGEDDGFISLIHSALAQLNLTVEEIEELCDRLTEAYENGEFNGNDGKDGKDGKDGEKGDKGDKGDTGDKGEPAKINGHNTVTIKGGKCCEIVQDGETLTLNIDGVPVYHTLPETAEDGDVCLYSPANVLTENDSGKTVRLDLEGITASNVDWFDIVFNLAGEAIGMINIGSFTGNDDGRFILLDNGKEMWNIVLIDGVLASELSSYIPDISNDDSLTVTELPQYFTLPAFDSLEITSEGVEKAIFYAPIIPMIYRGEWYEHKTEQTHTHNNKATLDALGCQALDTPITDGDFNFGINTEDWHRLKFQGDTFLFSSDGAVVQNVEVKEDDEKKFFRLYLNKPGLDTGLSSIPRFVDIPINGTNEKVDIGLNGTELELPTGGFDEIELTTETATLQPNTNYIFNEAGTLTLEFAEGEAGKRNEYLFTFISGATPTVLTLPSSVQWANELTVEANKRYEVSIVDDIGLWCAVEVNA